MKIRIMGTQEECEQARRYYSQFLNSDMVNHCSISKLYPNRNSVNQYRIYVDVDSKYDFMNTGITAVFKALAKLGGGDYD